MFSPIACLIGLTWFIFFLSYFFILLIWFNIFMNFQNVHEYLLQFIYKKLHCAFIVHSSIFWTGIKSNRQYPCHYSTDLEYYMQAKFLLVSHNKQHWFWLSSKILPKYHDIWLGYLVKARIQTTIHTVDGQYIWYINVFPCMITVQANSFLAPITQDTPKIPWYLACG
jgi:hypothetical protein